MKTILKTAACLACAALAGGALALDTPKPLVEGTGAPAEAVARLDKGELSLAMSVKFDKVPSKGSPTALLAIAAEADGRVVVTIPGEVGSLEGDYVFRSKAKVKPGEWHHLAFDYSLMRQRVAFYLDGSLQYENDNIYLPVPGFGGADVKSFDGAVKYLRAWDVALESERFLPASLMKGAERPQSGAFSPEKTIYDVKAAARDAALKERLAQAFSANPKAVKTDALAFYTTDPTSQTRVMPYMIPAEADFSGTLDVICAQEEFEAGSLVVMAQKPVKSFTVKMSDLVSADGARIPAADVDIRLVKRWYRTGGAWFSYFADFRHRILTPHLLVYDDDLIRVDEITTRNYYRLDYPEGVRYADVSDPAKGRDYWNDDVPFHDAKTLQPIKSLCEFGRNQQYWILFHATKATKPGVYKGAVDLVQDGKKVAAMPVSFRVLPFALPPRGASYDNLDRFYMSHVNIQGTISEGNTWNDWYASGLAEYKSMRDHNSLDVSGIWSTPWNAELARKAGFTSDTVWGSPRIEPWQACWPKIPRAELTAEQRKLGMRAIERGVKGKLDWYNEQYPDAVKWAIFYSESGAFTTLNVQQQDQAAIVHKYGWEVFAHGMGNQNMDFAGDIQDATIQTSIDREVADRWHAVDGSVGTYAKPFASPENPAVQRRLLGLKRYKWSRYDGNMQHGMKDRNPNQFAPDPGGDGNYRCQIMIMPTQGGFLETICWEGVREGFDDVRYATYLKKLAWPHLHDANEAVKREARRALVWLEAQNGADCTMQTVRLGIIDRILTLQALLAKNGGAK